MWVDSENCYVLNLWLGSEVSEQGITSKFAKLSTDVDMVVQYPNVPDHRLIDINVRSFVEEDYNFLDRIEQEFKREMGLSI